MNARRTFQTGCFLGAFAVIVLALAAHYLKNILTPDQLISVKTAAEIQLIHAGLIVFLSLDHKRLHTARTAKGLLLLITGICCFSFSIYLLALKDVLNLPELKIMGPITPVGGILIITAWIVFGFSYLSGTPLKND
jgi:uncharacterized membrane protein YgdD (TMEM256/DUF423 family)